MITQETIDSIQTVFRDHQGGGLWGLPYKMRHEIGQNPRHLWEGRRSPDPAHQPPVYIGYTISTPGPLPEWVWLGTPGWYGSMTKEEQELVNRFVDRLRSDGLLPQWPGEWQEVE
jgi:RNA-splicing ligase RtcB